MDVDVPGLDHRLGDPGEDGLMGGAAHHDGTGERPGGWLPATEHGVEQVNDGQVSEPRYNDVGQFLCGSGEIKGRADLSAGFVQQGQPLACPVLLGDVEHPDQHCPRLAGPVFERGDRDGPGLFAGLTRHPATGLPLRGFPRVEHLSHVALHRVVLGAVQNIGKAPSAQLVFGQPEHPAHAVIDSQAQQVLVMDCLSERRLGERPVHGGPTGLRVAVHLRWYRQSGNIPS
jgi:hypothetical protein